MSTYVRPKGKPRYVNNEIDEMYLSLGSWMVRASHRSSEGYGFDPRRGS